MPQQLPARLTREQAKSLIRMLPLIFAGHVSDPTGLVEGVKKAIGVEAMTIIREAYVIKARGGTDEAGISWKPLDPKTVAYGRRHPGLTARRNRAAKAGRASRPLLTAKEDQRWRGIFASTYRRLRAQGKGEQEAKGNAAALAWAILKRAGAKTILSEYGRRRVEVGRDTGRLLNSLSPRQAINRSERGAQIIGTNVSYAPAFHAKRPLWPEDHWPEVWMNRLAQVLQDGVSVMLRKLLGG